MRQELTVIVLAGIGIRIYLVSYKQEWMHSFISSEAMSNGFSTGFDLLISSFQNQLKWQRQEKLTISIEKQHKRTIELIHFVSRDQLADF